METTIKINTDALSSDFIDGVKKLFPHQNVAITIQLEDETDYILSNQKFADEISDRISKFEKNREVIRLEENELI